MIRAISRNSRATRELQITRVGLYCTRVSSFVELLHARTSLRALTRVVATVQCEPRNQSQQVVVVLALLLIFTIKLLHLL